MHTKYIKRGGKLYGPYYYESYRDGNKVKKRYISPEEFNLRNRNAPGKIFSRVNSHLFYSAILLFVITGVIFLLYNAQPTGKVNLAIETHYTQGEPLSGFLRFNLKQGELIPKDSKVVISLGEEQKEFSLFEIIDSGLIYSGDFFAEDSSLSGSGEGYGLTGSKVIYPEVNFELIIFSASAGDGSDGDGGAPENPAEAPVENSEVPSENPSEAPAEVPDDASTDAPAESSDSADSADEKGSVPLTGSIISENGRIISGKVSKGNDFDYTLEPGEYVEISSGSVSVNGEAIGDDKINLDISGNDLRVSTDYSTFEEGFGNDYLGEEIETLSADISKFGLTAQNGLIRVELLYGGSTLASASEDVSVSSWVISNESIIDEGFESEIGSEEGAGGAIVENETITNETIFNETLISETISNETIVNETVVNETLAVNGTIVNVITAREPIRLGRPVRWIKNVSLENSEGVVVDIPLEAERISVKKVEESGEAIEVETSLITGQVSAEIELRKESGFVKWLRSLISKITGTGRVIEGANESIGGSDSIGVVLDENATNYIVEYYTDAPTSIEEETGRGKRVIISGPENLNYTDIVSFANIAEKIAVGSENVLKILWVEAGTYVPFDAYDSDGNGMLDYVEWITPHLSNQTFEIILISKAEHLDENRTFISNVYELVKEKDGNFTLIPNTHYLRVVFEKNLTSDKDITIYAKSNNSGNVEVYEKDGTIKLADFENISEDREYKVYLTNLTNSQDAFDLKVSGGDVDFDYVVDPTVGACGNITSAGVYTLTTSVSSAGTCFRINASDVELDCAGFTITYGTSGGNVFGVFINPTGINPFSNVTVKNCIVTKTEGSGSNPHAITMQVTAATSEIRIINNTVSTNGGDNARGISVGGRNITVTGNTITTNSASDGGNIGVYVSDGDNVTVLGNQINTSGTVVAIGNDGVSFFRTNNSIISGNIIIASGSSANNDGIKLELSFGNIARNNSVTTTQSSSDAIRILGSRNNFFLDNRVNASASGTFEWTSNASSSIDPINNSATNLTLIRNGNSISLIDYNGTNIRAVLSTESPATISNPGQTPIGKFVNVTNNSATSWLFLNISYLDSEVTSAGISNESSLRIWKFNSTSVWTNVSFYQAGQYGVNVTNNYVFANITSFSGFGVFGSSQIVDSCPTTITLSSEFNGNLLSNGSCIIFGAGNISLDCKGYTLTGNGSGYGVNATNIGNITIRNCIIKSFDSNIFLSATHNSSIINNSALNSTSSSISLPQSSDNNLTDNIITGVSGISITGGGARNTLRNNFVNATSSQGINLQGGSENKLINNTVFSSSARAIILSSANNNIFENNSATSSSSSGIEIIVSSGNNLSHNTAISTSQNGILLTSSIDNKFVDTHAQTDAIDESRAAISLSGTSANNTFINTTLRTGFGWVSSGASAVGNNLTNTEFNATNGSIKVIPQVSLPSATNVNISGLNVTFNRAYLSSSMYSFLNTTGEITLRNLSFIAPRAIVDLEDDGSFVTCGSSRCNNLSYSGGVFVFNVSSFTTYSSEETAAVCGNVSSNILLSANLSSSGTCFFVNTSNIVIDCAGYKLTGNGAGAGVNVTGKTNVTVKNCIITTFAQDILFYETNSSLAMNNTLTVSGFSTHGIFLQNASGNNLTSNTISASGTASRGIELYLSSSANFITYNVISTSGSGGHGIVIRPTTDGSMVEFNNVTLASGGGGTYGILLETGSNARIRRNKVSVTNADGIGLTTSSASNLAESNDVIVAGDGVAGLNIGFSTSNNLTLNNVTYLGGTGTGAFGIYLRPGAHANALDSNIVSLSSALEGLSDGYVGVYFSNAENNTLFNTTLVQTSDTWLFAESSPGNMINLTIFDGRNSSIRIIPNVTIPASENVSFANLNASFNSAFLNSSNLTFLNTTGEITLRGLSSTNPEPTVDFEDDGLFTRCPSSICTQVSFGGGVFVYNVTHFTTYSSSNVSTISGCGTISESGRLNQSINSSATCITIGANNVELDCDGKTISYNSAGATGSNGVFSSGRSNVTIKHCIIVDVNASGSDGDAIEFSSTSNSLILNNTLLTNGTTLNDGVFFTGTSPNNRVINNTIVAFGTSTSNVGIRADAGGHNHTYSGNNISTVQSTSYGIAIASSNITIDNNEITQRTTGAVDTPGIYVGFASGGVQYNFNISKNTITTYGGASNFGSAGVVIDDDQTDGIIDRNVIFSNGTSPGITSWAGVRWNITNNNITTNGASNAHAILISGTSSPGLRGASGYFIENNFVNASGTAGHGIYVSGTNPVQIPNTTIRNNIVITDVITASSGVGIYIQGPNNTIVENNTITSHSSGGTNDGFSTDGVTTNAIVRNNVIKTLAGGSGSNYGISISFSTATNRNVTFINNFISTPSNESTSYGLYLELGTNISMFNTTFNDTGGWINIPSAGGAKDINMTNTTFQTANGSLNLPGRFNITRTAVLTITKGDLNITQNKVYLNSSKHSFLNITGIISLNGLSFLDIRPRVAFGDSQSFVVCNSPQCINLSYSGGVFVFNVSSFTSYSSQEAPVLCENLSSNRTGTQNLSSSGTCATISADNITIDCAGFTISGDGTGAGINATGRSGITIKNCTISGFDNNILFYGTNNSILLNNYLINATSENLKLNRSNNNNLSNNSIFIFDTGSWLSADSGSTNNILANSIFNQSNGSIRIISNVSIPASTAVTLASLNISHNKAFLNSSKHSFLNTSAEIIFLGINHIDPEVIVDYADNGTFSLCSASRCQAINFSSSKFRFNVTGFTTYSSRNISVVSRCGTLNASGTLNQSINSSATCMTIGVGGIELDCDGWTISYNSAGAAGSNGVFSSARTNVTVKNCIIVDVNASGSDGDAIEFANTNNSLILNNTLLTNGTSLNDGVYFTGTSLNNRVINNTIRTFGTADFNMGIRNDAGGHNHTYSGNNITTRGTTDNEGIYLSSSNITIINNEITTQINDGGSDNMGINPGAAGGAQSGFNITGNFISTTGGSGGTLFSSGIVIQSNVTNGIIDHNIIFVNGSSPGIFSQSGTRWNITNNNITTKTGGANVRGIYLSGGTGLVANEYLLENNIINLSGGGDGILVSTTAANQMINGIIRNNIIDARGVSLTSRGIVLDDSNYTLIENNTITVRNSAGSNPGIRYNANVVNSMLIGNRITTLSGGSGANYGIEFSLTNGIDRNTTLINNFISTPSNESTSSGIRVGIGANISMFNTTLNDTGEWISFSSAGEINMTNTTFQTFNGSITLPGMFNITRATALTITKRDINITFNKAYLNSTKHNFLNLTGIIALNGLSLLDPRPTVAFGDSASFATCSSPQCEEISYSSGVFVFNVSSFTSYSSEEAPISCGSVSSNKLLTDNLSVNGTCFTVLSNHTIIDCAGYTITGNGTGFGVNATNLQNITVKNCIIRNFGNNIYFSNSRNGTILNNSALNSTSESILLSSSSYNAVINNTIESPSSIALRLTSSSNNNITFNNATSAGSGSNHAIYLSSSNSNIINYNNASSSATTGNSIEIDSSSSNSVISNVIISKFVGIRLISSSASNNISFNNVTTLGEAGGIGMISSSSNNIIGFNNVITTNTSAHGIYSWASNNNITSNTVYTNGSNSHGIDIQSNGNRVSFNMVNTVGGGDSSFGLIVDAGGSSNIFTNNTIITTNETITTVRFSGSNNEFNNTILQTNAIWIASDSSSSGNNMTNTLFNKSDGSIRILPRVTVPDSATVNQSKLNITFNKAFMNSSNLTFLNVSAEITLRGLSFITPRVIVDFEDDGSFVICNSPQCNNLSYSGGVLVFNVSSFTSYSSRESNTAPNTPNVSINSTDGSNRSSQNLNCFAAITDPDNDTMNASVSWYRNSTLNLTVDFNNSYANGTAFNAVLGNGNLTKGYIWFCSLRLYDGLEYSGQGNSSNLSVLNSPPVVNLVAPPNGNATTNRTPTFYWNATDHDLDNLTYEFNISLVAASTCSEPDRYVTGLTSTNYTLTSDLQCFYDNGDYYNWSARAHDGQEYGSWATSRAINITAVVAISLPNSTIEFGSLGFLLSNDTTDDSPLPFLLQNDGNSRANVTVQATNLWTSVANPNSYYRFKARNSTEINSFNFGSSTTIFTNMTNSTTPIICLADLKYPDLNDSARIDIYVQVPPTETAGARNSNVTFTASLSE